MQMCKSEVRKKEKKAHTSTPREVKYTYKYTKKDN